ncbi:MAG: hypothetical protein FWF97_00250 [Alphaproteobacteria bacterium]|nr:hypothetical protein [Alphaproteobacteria bacterium]
MEMNIDIFSVVLIVIGFLTIVMIALLFRKINTLGAKLSLQTAVISRMQSALKSRAATNAVAQNSEIIYQDLLQHLIPVATAAGIAPRETPEHPLWQWAGGLMDEYSKNPYVLEQIRQAIKLDGGIARAADIYSDHASKFLTYLTATDPEGLLASAFSDGLLGQTMTLLAQARQLADN